MKTKLVYSVVSTEDDFYLEQTYVSMSSARHVMPDVFITLVMDTDTAEKLKGFRKTEAEFADEMMVVDLDPSLPAKKRSRILKTSLRNIVDGNFLYIDGDTLIVKDLSDADSFDFSLGAVQDRHVPLDSNPYYYGVISPDLKKTGIIVKDNIYHNSGVIYAKDNTETRAFYKRWNELYLAGYSSGVSQDQPTLAKTNFENSLISLIDDAWNCQIRSGLHYINGAKIWHYFSSNEDYIYILNNPEILMQIREQATIPENILSLFDEPFRGFPNICQIISGEDVEFYTNVNYQKLKKLFIRDTFVSRIINKILLINDKYYRLKKRIH